MPVLQYPVKNSTAIGTKPRRDWPRIRTKLMKVSHLVGKSILVVGKGSGLPSYLLGRRGLEVTTLDIQIELRPNLVGDVRHLPFSSKAFDVAVCCQVLEHLPFSFFEPSLRELRRVVKLGLVLSLPDRGRYSTILAHLLRRKEVIDLPTIRLRPCRFNGEHSWKVNTRAHPLHDVQRVIDGTGLKTERTFRVWEHPYHRFWRLRVGQALL